MDTRLLDGASVARAVRAELAAEVAALRQRGLTPGLAALLVGEDPASAVYVASKARACDALGIRHETLRLPASATTAEVTARVEALNARSDVHGILVQLPLPARVDAQRVLLAVDPAKDVDGFHPLSVGLLVQKRPRFVPCTPAGVMELLRREGVPLAGRRAVVLGRSDIVGKPMALLLLHADATVTICHSRTLELAAVTREADLLIAALGRPGFVRREHVKPGAVVVDVGINRVVDPALAGDLLAGDAARLDAFRAKGQAIVGDVHPELRGHASALTPVPGGVGPLTIAMLMRNTVAAARDAAA